MKQVFRVTAYTVLSLALTCNVSADDGTVAAIIGLLSNLQDSQPSGLVPIDRRTERTTTYVSAVSAIALISEGDFVRARRLLDRFTLIQDSCPNPNFPGNECRCTGGFQQHRSSQTGLPLAGNNDFWIGDNAWLLTAFRYYLKENNTNAAVNQRYMNTIRRLRNWFICLKTTETPRTEIGIFTLALH